MYINHIWYEVWNKYNKSVKLISKSQIQIEKPIFYQ